MIGLVVGDAVARDIGAAAGHIRDHPDGHARALCDACHHWPDGQSGMVWGLSPGVEPAMASSWVRGRVTLEGVGRG